MTEMPLISIVLPTYNGKTYLEQSVQSVIDQTYSNWELIIVDDCSTDDTPELIAELVQRDSRISSIRHPQNKKLPGALNTGFNAANGDYFSWTSDDNLYRPHAMETLVEYLQSNPDIDLVYADYTLIDDTGEIIKRVRVAPPNMLVRKATVDTCFLYRRAVHETLNGYDETLFLIEDYDFWMRASIHFKLSPLHEDLYQYRSHGESLTTQKHTRVMQLREEMLVRHLPNLKWASSGDLAQGYLHVSELASEHGRPSDARAYLLKALRKNPFVAVRHLVRENVPTSLQKPVFRIYRLLKGKGLHNDSHRNHQLG
jgi:glycosyltransferase involved in cell wall biosynthesis